MASKGKILVVDDDRLVLATVSHGLAQAGYEVIDADNGDDAILLARQHRPDLALLDIRMEGMSGLEVAEYLRDVGHTPFVFLSAFTDEATTAQVAALGALAYLVKPLNVSQIVPTVNAAFARARAMALAAAPLPSLAAQGDDVAQALRASLPLALGVLMQRHGISRGDALAQLRRNAAQAGHSLQAQSESILAPLEAGAALLP